MHPKLILLSAFLALSGCDVREDRAPTADPTAQPSAAPPAVPAPAAVARADPLTAAGPAASIPAEDGGDLQSAASVVRVDPLGDQGALTVKLFGTGGGDPAMNGLQTWLAVFRSPAEGWALFPIGDILDYRVLSQAPGRVDLEITESRLDGSSGEIGRQTRRVIIGWPVATDGAAPTAITLTPAR